MSTTQVADIAASEKKFQLAVYIILGVVSLAALLIYQNITSAFWQAFVKDLGIAGLIALILTVTIESFNRKSHSLAADRLINRINKNLFEAIYKRSIPDEIFNEVEKSLLQSNVFRRRHKICYSLEPVPPVVDKAVDVEEHVYCHAISTYEIHNTTNSQIEHTVSMYLEKPINKAWDKHCKVLNAVIDSHCLTNDEINDASNTTDPSHIYFNYPIKLEPNGVIKVHMEAKLLKQRVDSEVWASKIPSDGIELIVSSGQAGLKVYATANHSEKLEKSDLRNGTYKWELNHGMFPYQSIIFWWKVPN